MSRVVVLLLGLALFGESAAVGLILECHICCTLGGGRLCRIHCHFLLFVYFLSNACGRLQKWVTVCAVGVLFVIDIDVAFYGFHSILFICA